MFIFLKHCVYRCAFFVVIPVVSMFFTANSESLWCAKPRPEPHTLEFPTILSPPDAFYDVKRKIKLDDDKFTFAFPMSMLVPGVKYEKPDLDLHFRFTRGNDSNTKFAENVEIVESLVNQRGFNQLNKRAIRKNVVSLYDAVDHPCWPVEKLSDKPFVEQNRQTFRIKIDQENMGNVPVSRPVEHLIQEPCFYLLEISLPNASFNDANNNLKVLHDSSLRLVKRVSAHSYKQVVNTKYLKVTGYFLLSQFSLSLFILCAFKVAEFFFKAFINAF